VSTTWLGDLRYYASRIQAELELRFYLTTYSYVRDMHRAPNSSMLNTSRPFNDAFELDHNATLDTCALNDYSRFLLLTGHLCHSGSLSPSYNPLKESTVHKRIQFDHISDRMLRLKQRTFYERRPRGLLSSWRLWYGTLSVDLILKELLHRLLFSDVQRRLTFTVHTANTGTLGDEIPATHTHTFSLN